MFDSILTEALEGWARQYGESLRVYFSEAQLALSQFSRQIDELGQRYIDNPRWVGINLARKDKRGKNAIKGKARKRLKLLRSQFRRGLI